MRNKIVSLIIVVNILTMLLLQGCAMTPHSKARITEKALEKKYGEEFIVHETFHYDVYWKAYASPKNSPDIVFEVANEPDGTIKYDRYCKAYCQKLMYEEIKDDLEQFFPESYIRIYKIAVSFNDCNDFKEMPLDEIVKNYADEIGNDLPCVYMEIYLDKEVGSLGDYEAEYDYFTTGLNGLINEKKLYPIIATFYWTDKETIAKVEEYFKSSLNQEYPFITMIGDPPRMSACFVENAPAFVTKEEYIDRRREFENEKSYTDQDVH